MVVLTYCGSARSMMARDSFNPVSKMKYVKEAFIFLDQAVDEYSNVSYLPQLIRGIVSLQVPGFLGKETQGEKDLQSILDRYQADPQSVPTGVVSDVCLYLGNLKKSRKDLPAAIKLWQRSYESGPERINGKLAKRNIEKYGE